MYCEICLYGHYYNDLKKNYNKHFCKVFERAIIGNYRRSLFQLKQKMKVLNKVIFCWTELQIISYFSSTLNSYCISNLFGILMVFMKCVYLEVLTMYATLFIQKLSGLK